MCPLALELKKHSKRFETIVCVTGQHRDMLDQALAPFGVIPDVNLNVMKDDQDVFDITKSVLDGMQQVLKTVLPDVVLVHGDTTTSMAAALSAFYLHIPVGHVEAGLRTYDLSRPWPEEMNRQLIGRIADYHYCPLPGNKDNLLKENVNGKILVTGNTVIDALTYIINKMKVDDKAHLVCSKSILDAGYDCERLKEGKRLIVITSHRRENIGHPLLSVLDALEDLTNEYRDVDFVFLVHRNPHVRSTVEQRVEALTRHDNLYFIEPLDYLSFVYLMWKSYLILTDSGGIQEEAPYIGRPVLVMRDTSERTESISIGSSRLVGTESTKIIREVKSLIEDRSCYEKMTSPSDLYGDGKASQRIVESLKEI